MAAEINGIPLTNRKGLWFGEVQSKAYGALEAARQFLSEPVQP